MRIECPHCHAVFEVPEALAKGVKRLRCANCGDSWELGAAAVSKSEEAPDGAVAAPEVFEVPEEGVAAAPAVADSPVSGTEGTFRATGAMASRSNARRSAVLHSRSAGDVQVPTDTAGPSMIGSTGAWIAAWGASLVLAGGGVAALWYCKGAGVFGFLPGAGHFS
ncbi:zinc-ribbon domain-containing protein [Gluconobacter oxydans]|uniref:zinc-ribbon domain-containing protein n=1 Tax=Gluconobacter oxydans TaxID=442 RepID=UPI001CD8D638|nr:zinc-ribbon domain-containing protein [Gluconobacter oxydans]